MVHVRVDEARAKHNGADGTRPPAPDVSWTPIRTYAIGLLFVRLDDGAEGPLATLALDDDRWLRRVALAVDRDRSRDGLEAFCRGYRFARAIASKRMFAAS
jgi:hypothetical protein